MIPLADSELEQIAAKHVRNGPGTVCAMREVARRQREVIAEHVLRESQRPEISELVCSILYGIAEMIAPQGRRRS